MPRRKACAAVAPVEEVRPKILCARVLVTFEGEDGAPQTTETELPPEALAMLSEAHDVGVPTVDDVADAAQRAAELHLTLLRVDRSLVPTVDAIASVLVALPGVAAELERRAKGGR